MKVTIIIPCYNEYNNLIFLLNIIKKILIKFDYIYFILVNNGSQDETYKLFENNQIDRVKYINLNKNLGYGGGIKAGIYASETEINCWTHADEQVKISDVVDLINNHKHKFHKNYLIKGRRKNRNILDNLFTNFMSLFVFFITGIKIADINGQPKIFHRNLINYLIDNSPNDFSLDLHVLLQYKKKFGKINETNITVYDRKYDDIKGGGNLIGKVKLSFKTIKYILKYAFKKN